MTEARTKAIPDTTGAGSTKPNLCDLGLASAFSELCLVISDDCLLAIFLLLPTLFNEIVSG